MATTATKVKSTVPTIDREGVYFHPGSKQFVSRLGFELNAKGQRVRAFQYLGKDPEQAIVRHVAIVAEWKRIKAEWDQIEPVYRQSLDVCVKDSKELHLPVWVKPQDLQRGKDQYAESLLAVADAMKVEMHKAKADAGTLPPELRDRLLQALQPPANEVMGFTADAERLTVDQGRVRYLDDCKSRIGLAEEGIKPATYQNTSRMLRLALALKVRGADGAERFAIDPGAKLESITRDDLVAFKRAWLAKVSADTVAKRTAANYCKMVQYLFAWLYRRDRIVTRRVANLEEVFRFSDINPINIADYQDSKEAIKAILAAASGRVKLYVYLALNCGYYQADIGRLKLSEIVDHEGDKCIIRKREKTSHQNDFVACHALWPETWKLLESHLATADEEKNPQGLALLNEDDGPLYQTYSDRARLDNITSGYWRVVRAVNEKRAEQELDPLVFQFKQFRKIGATAMDRAGGETVQRLYRAAALENSDKYYVRGDFTKLTASLKLWREELKADGVL